MRELHYDVVIVGCGVGGLYTALNLPEDKQILMLSKAELETCDSMLAQGLQKLEELTGSYPGVEKAYAIQAGREVRIMVKPEVVTEDNMILLARDVAKKIESELEYPGQIKVNVIRETKAVEYAK